MLAAVLLAILLGAAFARMAYAGQLGRDGRLMRPLDTAAAALLSVGFGTLCALAAAEILDLGAGASAVVAKEAAIAAIVLPAARFSWATWKTRRRRRGQHPGEPALIVGAGRVGAHVERHLRAEPELGLRPVGYLDARPMPAAAVGGRTAPVLGSTAALERVVAATGASQLILAFTQQGDDELAELARRGQALGLEVSLVPRLFENVNARASLRRVGGLPLLALRPTDPRSLPFALKHAFDRTFAGLALLVLAPVLAAVAIVVKASSPGPVLFRQRRVGRDGHAFDILKFRTMREGPRVVPLRPFDGAAPGGVEGEDRRTRIGALLRRTSLDELPQLLNVVRGDMSLVGPRPERPDFVAAFSQELRRYDDRHRVRSGVTGWAQVHGLRGQTSLQDRLEWDNWYIENWSLWLDLKILLLTPLAVARYARGGRVRTSAWMPKPAPAARAS